MQIITGYTGKPHVTAEHDRDINIGIFGAESYVLPTGMMMEAEISSNNEIKIRDGVLMHQGCAGSIKKNTYDSVTITNGSQGMKRIDLIVVRYKKNEDTETEELKWVVLQGIPSEDAPETPDYTQGDIQAGDYVADMPMYEVTIDGLNITQIKKVFETTESLTELNGNMTELNDKAYLNPNFGKPGYTPPEGIGMVVSGIHLNNVTMPGLYFCTGTDGRPVSSDGFMIVISHTNGVRAIQIYFPYAGGMHKRLKTSDIWGSWTQISSV